MKTSHAGAVPTHPFFHAMVVMGGTVAIGCGGATSDGSRELGDGTGPSAAGGEEGGDDVAMGNTGGFRMESTGGTIPIAAGGSTNTGGSGYIGTPSTVGAPWDQGPEGCTPAQWSCPVEDPECSYMGDGVQVPSGCRCDPARPASAEDCPPDQVFVCRKGVEGSGGEPLGGVVPFECACVTAPADDCNACDEAFGPWGDSYSCEAIAPVGSSGLLCGCAIIYLR